jgi:carboxyl-terminal processing protease
LRAVRGELWISQFVSAAMPQRNLIAILLTTAIAYACYVRGERIPHARYVASGLTAIQEGALERVPGDELLDGAMHGMVEVLRQHGDEHSQYLPGDEADPLRTEIRQQFGGIGVRIRLAGDPARLTIAGAPEPDTPAARAKLRAGERILAIDERSTDGMNLLEGLNLLRGAPGSRLQLTVQLDENEPPRSVDLVREIIHIESILGDVHDGNGMWQFRLADDPRIAHVRIVLFGDRTADELSFVLGRLRSEGVQGVVLDLRDNAGGALEAAVAVCDLLLAASRTVVETRGRGGVLLERYVTSGNGEYRNVPLAVLINRDSASAAEIVAACLQDHGRAVIVGERSHGKGTVQQLLPVAAKSLLKLTWASFWRPSGANIHRAAKAAENGHWGVVPDRGYELELSPEELAAFREYRSKRDLYIPALTRGTATPQDGANAGDDFIDQQLNLAVEYLRGLEPGAAN